MSNEDIRSNETGGEDIRTNELKSAQPDIKKDESAGKDPRTVIKQGHLASALEKIGYNKGQYSEELLNNLPSDLAYLKGDILELAKKDKESSFSKEDFDRLYEERRDKEIYNESFPKIVKEYSLTDEQSKQLESEVKELVENHKMGYKKALDYATKGLDATSLQKAMRIANGAVAPHSNVPKESNFPLITNKEYDMASFSFRKEYSKKCLEHYKELKFK